MTPSPNTIQTLEQMGYRCGVAFGDPAVEQTALDAAQAAASPALIAEQSATVATDAIQQMAAAGALGDDTDPVALAQQIAGQVAATITKARTADVDFYSRSLEIAQSMATVWHVDGPGVSAYVSAKDDGTGWDDDNQSTIDALADQDGYDERTYQIDNPDAMTAMSTLVAAGHTVDRPTAGADLFVVDGTDKTGAELIELANS